MIVDATKNRSDSAIQTGKIVKGIFYLTRKNVFIQEYTAENKGEKDKTLIVEHPIRHGWHLVDSDKPIETTESLYRFKGHVAAGKASKLVIKEEIVQGEQFAILPADTGQLDFYSKQGAIPPVVKEALLKAMSMKAAMLETQRQLDQRNQQVAQITLEQQRIRENMRTVNQQSEYYTRLLKKLNDQESGIEKLQTDTEELRKKLETQRKDLEQYLAELNV